MRAIVLVGKTLDEISNLPNRQMSKVWFMNLDLIGKESAHKVPFFAIFAVKAHKDRTLVAQWRSRLMNGSFDN